MIFLAVIRLPVAVRDRCDACDEPAAALLATIGPRHNTGTREVEGKLERDQHPGGPDIFLLCTRHAADADEIIEQTRSRPNDRSPCTPSASAGKLATRQWR